MFSRVSAELVLEAVLNPADHPLLTVIE